VSGTWSSCESCIGGLIVEQTIIVDLTYIQQMLLIASSAGRSCTWSGDALAPEVHNAQIL